MIRSRVSPLGLKGSVAQGRSEATPWDVSIPAMIICPATAIAQAVRPAGKRFRDNDSAEGIVTDCHVFTGGLALGMEAEMIFGESTCPCEKEVPPAPVVARRNGDAY